MLAAAAKEAVIHVAVLGHRAVAACSRETQSSGAASTTAREFREATSCCTHGPDSERLNSFSSLQNDEPQPSKSTHVPDLVE